MDFHLDRRLLIVVSATSAILVLVALMVLPVGIPYIEHVVSYWWSDEGFQSLVGQSRKFLWYKKATATMLFLCGLIFGGWVWFRIKRKSTWLILTWSYFVFVTSTICSQYMAVGGWETHSVKNLERAWGDAPGMMQVIDSIDSPRAFLSDMTKYVGVNGELRGPLALKAPTYVLLFYYLDRLDRAVLSAVGLENTDLSVRAAWLAAAFTILIGLFLIPFFYLAQILYGDVVARTGLLVMSLSPMVAYGFAHWMAWGHHVMILVSSICLFLVVAGLEKNRWLYVISGLALSVVVGFVIWEAFALSGLLIFTIAARFFGRRNVGWWGLLARGSAIVVSIFVFISIVLFVGFDLNIGTYFWHHFMIPHVFFLLHKMFVSRGPLIYFASLFANVFQFLFFMGVALSVQLFYSLYVNWKKGFQHSSMASCLVWASVVFTMLLNISGMSTETGRLWAFLLPGFALSAFAELPGKMSERDINILGMVIFLLQGVQIVVERSVFFSI